MAACRRAQLRGWPNAAGTGMQVAPLRIVVVLHREWPYGRQPGPPAAGVRSGASTSPSLRADSRSARSCGRRAAVAGPSLSSMGSMRLVRCEAILPQAPVPVGRAARRPSAGSQATVPRLVTQRSHGRVSNEWPAVGEDPTNLA